MVNSRKKAVRKECSSNEKNKALISSLQVGEQQVELLQMLAIKWIILKVRMYLYLCVCVCVCVCVRACVCVWSVVGVSVGGETSFII